MLIGVGLVSGLLAGIFGIGGGFVIIPALVVFAGYPPKTAMATSLGVILFTAVAAAASHAQDGNVNFGDAALIGVPAAIGAVAGVALQRQIDSRRLVLAFAVLMALTSIKLAV